ncbi:hypothetical protein CsSME_00051430 [Camellia sinensis var. sinensis]
MMKLSSLRYGQSFWLLNLSFRAHGLLEEISMKFVVSVKKKGSLCHNKGMIEFNTFIHNMDMVDLPLLGRKFTWSNKQSVEKCCRLDCFLVSSSWPDPCSFSQ